MVGQATEAVRNVAESASDFARDTYDTGARYAREGWDSLPDVDRYSRAVSRPVEENPLVAILAAGAVGYLLAYMIHGSGFQGSSWQGYRKSVPDDTRSSENRRSRVLTALPEVSTSLAKRSFALAGLVWINCRMVGIQVSKG
jgi:hypothetical protein